MWTWRDTLERIQYIDTIINQIVSGGLVFDTILFGVFGALIALNSKDASINEGIVWFLLIVVSIAGIFINFFIAMNLARQEYNRQWYFYIFPEDKFPLRPHPDWLDNYVDTSSYIIDCPTPNGKPKERISLCKKGKRWFGFCESWHYIFMIITVLFYILLFFSSYNWFSRHPLL